MSCSFCGVCGAVARDEDMAAHFATRHGSATTTRISDDNLSGNPNLETTCGTSSVPGNPLLASDNELGIPLLDVTKQVGQLDAPVVVWGRERRKSRMRGTWLFYTGDARFNRLWSRPSDLIGSACVAAAEPNFSVHAQTPRALAIWHTYRKRWLARTWQDLGSVRILVDLNVSPVHRELNLLGVPKGWRAYSNRGSVDRLVELDEEHALAEQRAGGPVLYVVYGGGAAVRERCMERGWVWLPEEADVARGRA